MAEATHNLALSPPLTDHPTSINITSASLLHRLPRELRDQIYSIVAIDDAAWIGSPSSPDYRRLLTSFHSSNVTKDAPSDLIKANSNLIFTNREINTEYRAAVWRRMLSEGYHVQVKLLYCNPQPLDALLACCSNDEKVNILSRENMLVVIYSSDSLHINRISPLLECMGTHHLRPQCHFVDPAGFWNYDFEVLADDDDEKLHEGAGSG